jgi:RimJ/RimL family protein N-acetyltransferase
METKTARIRLQPQTPAELLALFDEGGPLHSPDVSPDWLAMLRAADAAGSTDSWSFGYAVVLVDGGAKVGDAGFKGPPGADGAVEIAYGIEPEHQGRGIATEAAAALVEIALADERVAVVRAHTLPDGKASQRVLVKNGFALVGEVVDPDDGLVWRWELPRPDRREPSATL